MATSTVAAVMLGLVALSPAQPVSALDQAAGAIRVTENQTVEKDFGPIPGQEPLPGLPSPVPKLNTPAECLKATYCDVVPLEVVTPPTFKPADEFFVSVTLSWQTQSIPGTAATPAQPLNDLDLYVWNDPQTAAPVQQASTATDPEELRLFRPVKGKYLIVVMNYVGPNTGYKLKVTYKPEKIVPPFESLDPGYIPPVSVAPPPQAPPDVSESLPPPPVNNSGAVEAPAPLPAPPAEAAPAPLGPVSINPDPDFSNFADNAFDQELADPKTDVLAEKQAKAVGPPKPASTSSLIFWLAIVPMLLAAAGGFWLSRKGSAVLRLR